MRIQKDDLLKINGFDVPVILEGELVEADESHGPEIHGMMILAMREVYRADLKKKVPMLTDVSWLVPDESISFYERILLKEGK